MRAMIPNTPCVHLGPLALSGTTPAASSFVDMRDFGACTIVLVNNTVTAAGASGFAATVQHSDTTAAADAAAIAATDSVNGDTAITVTSDTADNAVAGGIGYKGSKRYARVNVVGSSGTDASVSVVAVLNKPHRAKTSFVGSAVSAT